MSSANKQMEAKGSPFRYVARDSTSMQLTLMPLPAGPSKAVPELAQQVMDSIGKEEAKAGRGSALLEEVRHLQDGREVWVLQSLSGGVAYVYNPDGQFESLVNKSMCDLEAVAALDHDGDVNRPLQKAPGAHDNGMGDMLRHDAERLKILVERHLLYTGSKRARMILDNWDVELAKFVKVMPKDYRGALVQMETERLAAATVAAE